MTNIASVAIGDLDTSVDLCLKLGENIFIDTRSFVSQFGALTTLESDLLLVVSSIYACDLAFKRGERENFNRSIRLTIPVINFQAFESIKRLLKRCLYILSGDGWDLQFIRRDGSPEVTRDWTKNKGTTLLFSGGLDSFAAAEFVNDFETDLIFSLGKV